MHESQRATGLTEDKYIAIRIHYHQLADTLKENPSKIVLLKYV